LLIEVPVKQVAISNERKQRTGRFLVQKESVQMALAGPVAGVMHLG
jgi:hypothetical protein